MNLEKIKEFIIEKKKYLLFALAIVAAIIFFKYSSNDQAENFEEASSQKQVRQSEQSSSSFSIQNSVSSENMKEVTCDISGAVEHEGVYTLKNGARLAELIKVAGGLKKNAQLKAINRAIILKDQDKIHIPYKGEKVATAETRQNTESGAQSTGESTNSESNGSKINLNTASAADLQKLNGIGEKKSRTNNCLSRAKWCF